MGELVSVIIPTKNRSRLLIRAIQSILSQTYDNIEIIIVCDGSTDDTVQAVSKLYSEKNIYFISLDKSVGAAEARNIGIDNSRGTYIAFLDDDDVWKQNKLSKQLYVFNKFRDTAIVSCFYSKIKNGKKKVFKSPLKINLNDILYNNSPGSFSFCLTKKKYINDIRIDRNLKKAQDWYLWINILNKTGKVCRTVPEDLVYYNVESINKITQKSLNAHFDRIEFYRTVWDIMSPKQKYYNIKVLYNEKNSLYNGSFLNSIKLSLFSVIYHIKSNNNLTIYELLRNFAFLKKYLVF